MAKGKAANYWSLRVFLWSALPLQFIPPFCFKNCIDKTLLQKKQFGKHWSFIFILPPVLLCVLSTVCQFIETMIEKGAYDLPQIVLLWVSSGWFGGRMWWWLSL